MKVSLQGQKARTPKIDFRKNGTNLSVKLAADRSAVDSVVQQIMTVVRQMKTLHGREDAVELALSEALANAVVHGAKGDPTKIIECEVACDRAQGVLIVVRDPGNGFTPQNLPNPVMGENLYANHGRGIYLINQLMDEVKFYKNGTEIHMIKR